MRTRCNRNTRDTNRCTCYSFLMWVFDRWSPYSYQNNRNKYKDDEEKREFNLKECLWFCMTSLTPQVKKTEFQIFTLHVCTTNVNYIFISKTLLKIQTLLNNIVSKLKKKIYKYLSVQIVVIVYFDFIYT